MENEFLDKNETEQKVASDFKLDVNLDTSFLRSATPVDFNLVVPGSKPVAQKKSVPGEDEKEEFDKGSREAPQRYFSNATSVHDFGNSSVSTSAGLSIPPPPFQLKADGNIKLANFYSNKYSTSTAINQPIQRNVPPPPPAPRVQAPQPAPPENQQEPAAPANKEKEDFLKGKYGPKSIIPAGFGGFEAQYIPNSGNGTLNVVVRASLRFMNALEINGGVVTSNAAGLNQIANKANRMQLKAREAFCGQYQWNAKEKSEKVKEYQTRMNEVAKMWSGAHTFFIDKDDWRDVKSGVSVAISVKAGDAKFEAAGGTDHLQMTAVKSPPQDAGNIGAFVENQNKGGKIASEMVIADELKEAKHLNYNVQFATNSSEVQPFEIGKLKFIANKFKDSDKNDISNKIQIITKASTTGDKEANEKLAQKRIDAVNAHLKAFGFKDGGRVSIRMSYAEGPVDSPEFRGVDIIIGSGQKQNALAHEMGHVFGLGDEYVRVNKDGSSNFGKDAEHNEQSEKMGGGPAVIESNDSIMSNGNEVRKQHYASFGSALNQLTSQTWKIS